jgi:hypothetical protein
MGIAVPNRETMCKARQPLGYPVYVARDALLETRHSDLSPANCKRFALGITGVVKIDLFSTTTVSLSLRKMFFVEIKWWGKDTSTKLRIGVKKVTGRRQCAQSGI